ncbi:MAG: endonuclease/exonuclease/phosphatase family protein [Chloroflexi bacterium]|nr:endonuclease/exonuclease/phosphatase family protein [Chloroflexota bacterium]
MRIRRDFLRSVEAGLIGFFVIQAVRFLYGTLYAHISSADLVRRVADDAHLVALPGYIEPATVERELVAVGIALLAPLLALILARTIWSIPLAVALVVVGRSMALQNTEGAPIAAALVVGAGLLYISLIIIRRPTHFPAIFIIGISLDLLIRAANNTADPTWDPDYQWEFLGLEMMNDTLFLIITVGILLITGYTTLSELEVERVTETDPPEGVLTGWGSLALGSFIFIELTLLGLANAVAHWADTSYAATVSWLILATTLPLVPGVRDQTRRFLGAFDGAWRGWLWALLLGLFLVLGRQFSGPVALLMLVLAQFVTILTIWWVVKLRDPVNDTSLPNPTAVLMLVSLAVFGVLTTGDYFTYDYAFVRDLDEPFAVFEEMLRALRGVGLELFLVAAILACLPIVLERRVIPWRGGRRVETYLTGLLVLGVSLSSLGLADAPPRRAPRDIGCLRIATLNIHSGYTLLFEPNLDLVAEAIARNGADIVLLQEVDAGRMSSFGVDQAEWLARDLHMEAHFFPLNEALQGLAVLSRVPIQSVDGEKFDGEGPQAGMMHVQLSVDEDPFHIYNVWISYQTTDEAGQPLPLEAQDQTQQTRQLEQIIVRNHAPDFDERIVLGGTFNYDRDTDLYRFWDEETTFIDPFQNLALERTYTLELVDNSRARFDYIWLMNLIPSGVGIDLDYVVSDHRLAVTLVNRTPAQECNR